MINIVRDWRDTAVDIILPPTCALCGGAPAEREARFCEACHGLLTAERCLASCRRCAMPLPAADGPAADGPAARPAGGPGGGEREVDAGCAHCRSRRFAFAQAFAFGFYRGVLREAVIASKQTSHAPLTLALGELLAETLRSGLGEDAPDGVLPVPSHWTRRLRRGGVPAQWLAESIGQSLGIRPLQTLRCIRRTKKQGTLPPEKRAENVRHAFRAKTGYAFGASQRAVAGRHLLLVDDVLTTGSTGDAAAAALRTAGAERVTLAVIARATG